MTQLPLCGVTSLSDQSQQHAAGWQHLIALSSPQLAPTSAGQSVKRSGRMTRALA